MSKEEETNIINISSVERVEFDFKKTQIDEKIIKNIEKLVRGGDNFHYMYFFKGLIANLKTANIDNCRVFPELKMSNGDKIEIHHYPLTLYEICEIVCRSFLKEQGFYKEMDVAKLVTLYHITGEVSLIPLSVTVHNIWHSNPNQINFKQEDLLFDYTFFVKKYKEFITPAIIEKIENINKVNKEIDPKFNYERSIINCEDFSNNLEFKSKNLIMSDKYDKLKKLELKK